MLPILGVTMLEAVLQHLASHDIDEAVLALGYQPDVFIEAFPEGQAAGVRLHYAVEPEPLDTAGAIRFAAAQVGWDRGDEAFFAFNGDVLTGLDLGALWKLHHNRRAEATIALTQVEDPSRFGVVPTDESGLVLGFVEKPPIDEAPTDWINAGCYVLEPSVCKRIIPNQKVSLERVVFPGLVADKALYAMASPAHWVDAGTPISYLEAHRMRLAGENWFGPDVEVAPGAKVSASAVGAGSRIGDGAVVEDSVLLPGCVIEAGAVVHSSLLGEAVRVGSNARVEGLSVLGDGDVAEPGEQLSGVLRPQ